MKQLLISKGKTKVAQVPSPQLRDGMVLVKNHYSFISSGTERSMLSASGKSVISRLSGDFRKTFKKLATVYQEHGLQGGLRLAHGSMSRLLEVGYSCSGQVIEAAPGTPFSPGDWVACAGVGFAVHAELCAVPKNLVVKIAKKDLKASSVIAIGAIALQGFRRSQLKVGETVCVVGLGLVGLLTVQIARNAGCQVFGVDPNSDRRNQALKFGACKVIDPTTDNVASDIAYGTKHRGVDATIVTAPCSSGRLISQAIELTRQRGRIVAVGDTSFNFSRETFYRKEQDLVVSCSYGPGRYDNSYEKQGVDYPFEFVRWTENRNMQCIIEMIADGRLDVFSLVDGDFDITQADAAYKTLESQQNAGLIFSYEQSASIGKGDIAFVGAKLIAKKDTVGVAVVGAGGFSKTKLLPVLSDMKTVSLQALVDPNAAKTLSLASQFNIPMMGSDFQTMLGNEAVDAVVIATPHMMHAQQSLLALQAGKSVFVEKPAVVSFDELDELKIALSRDEKLAWFVDFNRSQSNLVQKVKDVLKGRAGGVQINYRMNAGRIPAGHWINDAGNKGRVIGEACHIFELFLELVKSPVQSLSVGVSTQASSDSNNPENLTASLMFADGSSATLAYVACGSSTLSKERMELFWEGKSIVMDDFTTLKGYGLASNIDTRLSSPDKGHAQIMEQFIDVVRGNQKIDSEQTKRWIDAMDVTLHADRLARMGGGFHIFE